MREFLIILIVILILLAIAAFRYRRQILAAVQVWRMIKKMRQMNKPAAKDNRIKETDRDVELVRCARCGSWKPQNEALKFSRGTFYCSSACVNEALNVR